MEGEISFCDLKHSNCVHFIVIRFNRVEGSCVCDWWGGGGGGSYMLVGRGKRDRLCSH